MPIEAQAPARIHPGSTWSTCILIPNSTDPAAQLVSLSSHLCLTARSEPPSAQSPFASCGCYPQTGCPYRTPQKTLLFLHRSYRLMRQTNPLPPPRVSPSSVGSLQVVASPCWKMVLPNIISAILVKSLGPIPRHVSWMHLPTSSPRTPASHDEKAVRHVGVSLQCNTNRGVVSRLQSFVYLQASSLARPPGCTYRSSQLDAEQPGRLHHA